MADKSELERPKSDGLPRSLGSVMRVLRCSPPTGAQLTATNSKATKRRKIHSVEWLAEILDETPGRPGGGRTPNNKISAVGAAAERPCAKFTDDTVHGLEKSQHFDVWKIARYANWSGYPVSVILLVQELSAQLRDGELELVSEIAEATIKVCKLAIDEKHRLASNRLDDLGQGRSRGSKEEFVSRCRNTESQNSDQDRLFLIADELFKAYPESALVAKRSEWQKRKTGGTNGSGSTSS